MLHRQIALVSESKKIPFKTVTLISAALQKQISRDFTPIWNIRASIDPFMHLKDVPLGYWPIVIKDDLKSSSEGFHLDKSGQPYSLVSASEDVSLTCSHEMIEMLVDPFGNHLLASDSINPENEGRVNYLVEACDPCAGKEFGYTVNGFLVSDFYTPNYFDPISSDTVRYSFNASIKTPKEVLNNGYLTWFVPETGEIWQAQNFDGTGTKFLKLGLIPKGMGCWRELIDRRTKSSSSKSTKSSKKNQTVLSENKITEFNLSASISKSESLMQEIQGLDNFVDLDFSVEFVGGFAGIEFNGVGFDAPKQVAYNKKGDPNPVLFTIKAPCIFSSIVITGTVPNPGSIEVKVSKAGQPFTNSTLTSNPVTNIMYYDLST